MYFVRYRIDGLFVNKKNNNNKKPPHKLTQNEQGMWRCRTSRDRAVNAIYRDRIQYSLQ